MWSREETPPLKQHLGEHGRENRSRRVRAQKSPTNVLQSPRGQTNARSHAACSSTGPEVRTCEPLVSFGNGFKPLFSLRAKEHTRGAGGGCRGGQWRGGKAGLAVIGRALTPKINARRSWGTTPIPLLKQALNLKPRNPKPDPKNQIEHQEGSA